ARKGEATGRLVLAQRLREQIRIAFGPGEVPGDRDRARVVREGGELRPGLSTGAAAPGSGCARAVETRRTVRIASALPAHDADRDAGAVRLGHRRAAGRSRIDAVVLLRDRNGQPDGDRVVPRSRAIDADTSGERRRAGPLPRDQATLAADAEA